MRGELAEAAVSCRLVDVTVLGLVGRFLAASAGRAFHYSSLRIGSPPRAAARELCEKTFAQAQASYVAGSTRITFLVPYMTLGS